MDNSKATTGGDGLPARDQNTSLSEKLNAAGSDAARPLPRPDTWADMRAENTQVIPVLLNDGDKLKEKLPHLELLFYELAAQRLIDAISETSKKLTGQDLFSQPAPHIARMFRHMSEFTEQFKSLDGDTDKSTNAHSRSFSGFHNSEPHAPLVAQPVAGLEHAPLLAAAPKVPVVANRVTGEGNATLTHASQTPPILVTAVKAEPGAVSVSRTEIKPTAALESVSAPGSNRVEQTASPAATANPFQNVMQVAAREDVVVDGAGHTILNAKVRSDVPSGLAALPGHNGVTTQRDVSVDAVESKTPSPLISVSQLLVKEPVSRSETGNNAQPVANQNLVNDKASSAAPSPARNQEMAPQMVAAVRVEGAAPQLQGVENPQPQSTLGPQSSGQVARADSAPQPTTANPFQNVRQVVVREEAVVDGSGRTVVKDAVASTATSTPFVANARAVPDSNAAIARNSSNDSGDANRPPVITASQLIVKEPSARLESNPSAQNTTEQSAKGESSLPTQVASGGRLESQPVTVVVDKGGAVAPVVRGESQPVLVPAVKLASQAAPTAPAARVEGQPVLVPAVRIDGQTAPVNPAARVEGQPVLVPAVRVDNAVVTAARSENQPVAGEAPRIAASAPTVLAARSDNQAGAVPVAKVENQATGSPQLVSNPFQNVTQVAVKENAITDGGGKTVVNEAIVSAAPLYVARVVAETNPAVRAAIVDSGETGRAPVISASQLVVREPVTPAQNVYVASRPEVVSPVVLPPRVEAAAAPVLQNSPEPPKPQALTGNPFLSHTQVLAREDSLTDPVSKKVIAENISQYTPTPIASVTPRPQPVNPSGEAVVVRPGAETIRDNNLARSSNAVVAVSQLVVKDPGAPVKADSTSKSEQQSRPVTLVKAEPVPKAEAPVRAVESSKIEAQTAPGQPVAKAEAVALAGQPNAKDEALVASAAPGTVLSPLNSAPLAATKQAEKLVASDTPATAGTLEGLFETVGRSKLLASGAVAAEKATMATDLTGAKSNSDAGSLNARQLTLGIQVPASRVANVELQIVDAKGGQSAASTDAAATAMAGGSVLTPGTAHALPVKSESITVKAENQSLVLDGKTTVRAGLKDNEVAVLSTALTSATGRNNAGGTGTVTGNKSAGATGSSGAGSVVVPSGIAGVAAGTTTANSNNAATTPALPGMHVSNTTVAPAGGGATANGINAGSSTVTGKGAAATVSAVAGGAGGGVGGANAGDPASINVSATTVSASTDPSGVSVLSNPVSGSVPNTATVDPMTLQPLTLVDGDEVVDGRLKGEHVGAGAKGKKIKTGENGKEPDSKGGEREHGKAHNHTTKVRPQPADYTLSLEEIERRQREEAARRKKMQEKARKPKAHPPKQTEKQRRCHILKGDTLESLALQYLGASNLATLIYRINQGFWWERRHANKIYLELLPGTVIFLPTTTEIAQFRDNLSKGKVKLLQFEYLSCEHVRSLRQLLANARVPNANAKPQVQDQGQFETIAQEDVTASLSVDATATVAMAPVPGTFVAVAARCDKMPTPLTAPFAAAQTGRLLVPGQTVQSERLEENSRVVEINAPGQSSDNHCRVQLQVWYGGQWLLVMEYVISDEPTLNVHSLAGAKREIKILLPASAVKSMALNDLTSNRLEYGRRFLLGRKILL